MRPPPIGKPPPASPTAGISTISAAAVPSAASTAPPPARKVSTPTDAASGCPHATVPSAPRTSGRRSRIAPLYATEREPMRSAHREARGVPGAREGLHRAAALHGTAQHAPAAAAAHLDAQRPPVGPLRPHEARLGAARGRAELALRVEPAAAPT